MGSSVVRYLSRECATLATIACVGYYALTGSAPPMHQLDSIAERLASPIVEMLPLPRVEEQAISTRKSAEFMIVGKPLRISGGAVRAHASSSVVAGHGPIFLDL